MNTIVREAVAAVLKGVGRREVRLRQAEHVGSRRGAVFGRDDPGGVVDEVLPRFELAPIGLAHVHP